jgi:hypothetical protein
MSSMTLPTFKGIAFPLILLFALLISLREVQLSEKYLHTPCFKLEPNSCSSSSMDWTTMRGGLREGRT